MIDCLYRRLAADGEFQLFESTDGIGVTTAEVFDRQGFIGVVAQTLLVQRRT